MYKEVITVSKLNVTGDAVDNTSRYVPPSFVDQCPPQDLSQSYTVPPGRNYVTIKWTEPIAIDQFGKQLR
jgi:hypothetical protein